MGILAGEFLGTCRQGCVTHERGARSHHRYRDRLPRENIHTQARRLGAVAMFDKPFDVDDLVSKVAEILAPESLVH